MRVKKNKYILLKNAHHQYLTHSMHRYSEVISKTYRWIFIKLCSYLYRHANSCTIFNNKLYQKIRWDWGSLNIHLTQLTVSKIFFVHIHNKIPVTSTTTQLWPQQKSKCKRDKVAVYKENTYFEWRQE